MLGSELEAAESQRKRLVGIRGMLEKLDGREDAKQ